MRIAIVSDIHGNIRALEAVLADIRRAGADRIVNAGDILSGPLEPSATADLVMSLNLPTIRGNHERHLLACEHERGEPSDQYAYEHTTEAQREWLRGLPAVMELSDEVFMCHGTPASDLIYLLERVDQNGASLARTAEVEAHLEGYSHSLIICGHSHRPRAVALPDGRLVVNPGSVGLQAYDADRPAFHVIENGSPHARYAICERGAHGWNVEHRCVVYDYMGASETARRNGRRDWAGWLATGMAS
jgi:putative phosphoesterase